MIYDGTELKDTPLEGLWERGVRIVESKEVVEVDNGDSRDYRCRVWSQTRRDMYYDVHNTRDGWTCRCESFRLGRKIVCRHRVAAFIPAASGSRQSKKKAGASFELPERWCRYCGSTNVAWSESRPLRRMSALCTARVRIGRGAFNLINYAV